MGSNTANNKRIAKNTLLLYVRMLLLMVVSLYTSRVILNGLGVVDYGIYNVVGGVVTMFSMLSGSLTSAITRFLTFELGKGNRERLNRMFSASVTIQIVLALIILLLAETVGLWFLNKKMVIPEDRLFAANWCYQFSLITFCIRLISVPYNSSIVSHEKMSAFAYISIFEALGILSVAISLSYNPFDKLVFYGLMVAVLAVFIQIIYRWYCKKHFEECHYHFIWDKELLKSMFSFAGWNFIGASSSVLREQGGSIILNLFFGPSVNAARAIATKVNSVVSGFVQNFMMALNPQITKNYASGDYDYMFKLVFQGARLSYYILLLLSLPIIINCHYILVLWLKIVPEHTVYFVQLTLLLAMNEAVSNTLVTVMLATGKIKKYQIVVGGLQLLNLPISYLCLKLGLPAESVLFVAIVLGQCCLYARLWMLREMIGLRISSYLKDVYLNVIIVTLVSSIIPVYFNSLQEESAYKFIIISLLCVTWTLVTIFVIGMNKQEKSLIIDKLTRFIKR